jgi:putative acetyltransferase
MSYIEILFVSKLAAASPLILVYRAILIRSCKSGETLLTIRPEISEDQALIHYVNQEAFGRIQEADLVDKLRKRGVLTVSLVAVQETAIVGHIAFSPVEIASEKSSFGALTLAPIAVLPTHQNKGIGSQLVIAGLQECLRLGHEIIVVVGHPTYYPRFGFVPANPKGVECEFEVPDEAWMITELKQGALAGIQGKVIFQPEFREAM